MQVCHKHVSIATQQRQSAAFCTSVHKGQCWLPACMLPQGQLLPW